MKILINANIYTLNPHQPHAEAIVIDKNRVITVGKTDDILREFNMPSSVEDLQGKTILPGLTDAHIHLEYYALALQKIDCETRTRAECLAKVAARATETPKGEWILGHGWNQNEWPKGFGDAELLDTVAPDHPVYLTAKSLHAGWANTLALKRGNVTADTPDPKDGALQRREDGSPTGILFETAMQLVSHVVPATTQAQSEAAIRDAQPVLWAMGVTGVHDFDGRRCFISLQNLQQRGELGLRVIKSIPLSDLDDAIGVGLRTGFGNDYLRIGNVKAFADGALGPHTAAMFAPYEDDPSNTGILMLEREEIIEHGQKAAQNGLGMVIHAIGDRANHEVIEAYTHLRTFEAKHALPHYRHRIEHVQLLHPNDFGKLAAQQIIASMQPVHATSDITAANAFWGNRSKYAYAWRSLLDMGTAMAFGSDAPVDSPNPFWGLHAALTRRRGDGSPGQDGWYPEQRITRLEALQGYTTGAAFAAGMETRLGQLAPGYLADLIILDADYFRVDAMTVRDLLPSRTMVDGSWVFSA